MGMEAPVAKTIRTSLNGKPTLSTGRRSAEHPRSHRRMPFADARDPAAVPSQGFSAESTLDSAEEPLIRVSVPAFSRAPGQIVGAVRRVFQRNQLSRLDPPVCHS